MKPETLNELALFAGAGGGILGGKLLGWRTVCAVEWNAYARDVLVARQNDGCLAPFPVWDDVCTFDGHPWRGRVDVVSGGFPCQDISAAGKGAGIEGERSGMWKHMARIIGEVLPQFVFVENSPMLVGRGLGTVLADLASLGYDAEWGIVGAHHISAPHKRDRIWIMANSNSERGRSRDTGRQNAVDANASGQVRMLNAGGIRKSEERILANTGHMHGRNRTESGEKKSIEAAGRGEDVGDSKRERLEGTNALAGTSTRSCEHGQIPPTAAPDVRRVSASAWWATEPELGRVAHGVACRVDRLRCIGNGQVPAVVPLAWNLLRPTTDEIQ